MEANFGSGISVDVKNKEIIVCVPVEDPDVFNLVRAHAQILNKREGDTNGFTGIALCAGKATDAAQQYADENGIKIRTLAKEKRG